VGGQFEGRINGVTRAGLFVTLTETGADGLLPMRSLGGDFYLHDESRHRLVGRRFGRTFTLGDPVRVRLAEANAVTGSLLFALAEDEAEASAGEARSSRSRRGRNGRSPAPRSAGYTKRG